jgi:hypothetical protein
MAYAEEVLKTAKTPVMVTGGFRSKAAMEEAVDSGVAVIGIGRPLCVIPDAPRRLLNGDYTALPAFEETLTLGSGYFGPASKSDLMKAANGFAALAFFYRNIIRMADGKASKRKMNLWGALIAHQLQERADAKQI